MKKVWELAGYTSGEELAGKIDWEGGLPEYILHYAGNEGFYERSPAFKQLDEAWEEIQRIFEEDGAVL